MEEVVVCWEKKHKFANNTLYVKPVSWVGTSFFPVEKLLDGYGYLKVGHSTIWHLGSELQ